MATKSPLQNKGTYLLFLELREDSVIRVGRLGEFQFKRGIYLYVGSAMNGFGARIRRYISGGRKRHWHIDYLLDVANLMAILLIPSETRIEEEVASLLEKKFEPVVDGFGSSDTNSTTHLFYLGDLKIG